MSEIPNTVEVADDFVKDVVEPIEEGVEHPHWHKHVAMTTLVMALLTALAAMLAGTSSQQSLIERTQEIMEINSLESDRIQVEVIKTKHEILIALEAVPDQAEAEAIAAFERPIREHKRHTDSEESTVISTIETHHIFAVAATLLSMGTALNGMSVIVNRKYLWVTGLVFGAIGTLGVLAGVVRMFT
jgi:hypothetical protein